MRTCPPSPRTWWSPSTRWLQRLCTVSASHLHCRFSFILLNCRGSQGNDGRVQTRMFHSRSLYFGRQEAHRGNWESVQEGQKDCQRWSSVTSKKSFFDDNFVVTHYQVKWLNLSWRSRVATHHQQSTSSYHQVWLSQLASPWTTWSATTRRSWASPTPASRTETWSRWTSGRTLTASSRWWPTGRPGLVTRHALQQYTTLHVTQLGAGRHCRGPGHRAQGWRHDGRPPRQRGRAEAGQAGQREHGGHGDHQQDWRGLRLQGRKSILVLLGIFMMTIFVVTTVIYTMA